MLSGNKVKQTKNRTKSDTTMLKLVCLVVVGLSGVTAWRDSRPRMVVDYLKQHTGTTDGQTPPAQDFEIRIWETAPT